MKKDTIFAFNPGSDSTSGATLEQARINMQRFLEDLGNPALSPDSARWPRLPVLDSITSVESELEALDSSRQRYQQEGRYHFLLSFEGNVCLVAMPGLPLEQVRCNTEDCSGWVYSRLFIGQDASSWLWPYALSAVRDSLLGIPED